MTGKGLSEDTRILWPCRVVAPATPSTLPKIWSGRLSDVGADKQTLNACMYRKAGGDYVEIIPQMKILVHLNDLYGSR